MLTKIVEQSLSIRIDNKNDLLIKNEMKVKTKTDDYIIKMSFTFDSPSKNLKKMLDLYGERIAIYRMYSDQLMIGALFSNCDTHRPKGQCFLIQRILYSNLLRLDTP
tara:strand:- start:405 stop:725 length:321 start_codon:yes stop_codon:yes gene_type:complete